MTLRLGYAYNHMLPGYKDSPPRSPFWLCQEQEVSTRVSTGDHRRRPVSHFFSFRSHR
ncbi:hypothetical protein BAUCODRAFT_317860 [Baudoinia panamericana UAMH 10762]|uniref:Uncharacterized protein n=1 Tax=Baudoinia panamericana (strain UAMH 10762) TaxID=717646 RepID=M2LBG7_BAUPA|nr:uncharacterized protein BAUCODRAFT_317860 [Baudoinia panamericana UAMH 10762]EMC91192.1 hypothetical protein BAUCODRAFT_317860 [Baudoinia panamericana UAMH 10762]